MSARFSGGATCGVADGCADDTGTLDAGCEVTDVAMVDERASEGDVELVDRFFSFEESEGECERSLAESLGVVACPG